MKNITQERLQSLFSYDAESGILTHGPRSISDFKTYAAYRRHLSSFAYQRAGYERTDSNGYTFRSLSVDGSSCLEHRVIWLLYYGKQPPKKIDHINRDATDNRISNMRDGTDINDRNRWLSPKSTTGLCGVNWNAGVRKFQACVKLKGKNHYLGLFEDKWEAFKVAQAFREKNGFDPTHGQPKESSA